MTPRQVACCYACCIAPTHSRAWDCSLPPPAARFPGQRHNHAPIASVSPYEQAKGRGKSQLTLPRQQGSKDALTGAGKENPSRGLSPAGGR
ncbi:MAG: hypothetical protein ACPIOQ_66840 [Promethearchaeia archaeon]